MGIAEMTKIGIETIDGLSRCFTKEDVDGIFSKYKIDDPKDKIELLRMCMKVREVYSTPSEIDPEAEYNDALLIFLDGSWRLLA